VSLGSVAVPYRGATRGRTTTHSRNRLAVFFSHLTRNRAALAGGIILMLLVLIAALAPIVAPYGPNQQSFADYLSPPGPTHLFGTDELGRDGLSRVIFGSRISLWIGVIAVSIAVVGGLVLGLLAGYYGGWTDNLIMRGMDVMLAFPEILLALAVVAVLGPALTTVMVAVGIASIPYYTRVVRSSVLAAKHAEYVIAAQVIGSSANRIILRHIMPNSIAPVLVLATTGVAAAIITGAALSFLGLGVQPPTPEWGSMLSVSRNYLQHAPWMAVFPGLAIMLTVVAINLLGDGVRDALDPRLT
jgi:peptide/nickel transport system permease protein